MDYTIKNYFDSDECSDIIQYCMDNGELFSYNPNENWDCRRIHTNEFKEKILFRFKELHINSDTSYWFNFDKSNVENVNISLTRYYNGRFLNLHKDTKSQFTTVIVLTNQFEDGRFVLSNMVGNDIKDMRDDSTKINLELGQGISFDGGNVLHGVMPVYSGIRCALNIWMVDGDYNYSKFKNTKTLL